MGIIANPIAAKANINNLDVVNSLTDLANADKNKTGAVYLNSGGRSGVFSWDGSDLSTEVTADTLQGVYVAPNSDLTGASGAWVRELDGFVTPEMFGLLIDSVDDQTDVISAALLFQLPVVCLNNFYANVDVSDINIDITGTATIKPFNRLLPAIKCTSSFLNESGVSLVETVTQTVSGMSNATVSKITSIGNSIAVGDVIKLFSDDLIPTCKTSDNVKNGEWGIVLEVDGDDIYINRVVEQTYTSNIRIAKINKDIKCNIGICFSSSTGNGSQSSSLLNVKGFYHPKLTVSLSDNDGIGLFIGGNYGLVADVNVRNLTDDVANGIFGYGVLDSGNGLSSINVVQSGFCRHAYTTGKSSGTAAFDYGESWFSTVSGSANGCTSAGFDTHEMGSDITFSEIESVGCRALVQSRSRRTRAINPKGSDCYFSIIVTNTESYTQGELEVFSVISHNTSKPINCKDQSGTGNKIKLILSGDSSISYKSPVAGTAIDIEGDLVQNGTFDMVMMGGTDNNFHVQRYGTAIINGLFTINLLQGSVNRPFKMNSDYIVTSLGHVDLLTSNVAKLFTASTAGDASSTNIIANNMTVNTSLSPDNWFEFPFNSELIKIHNSDTVNHSSARIGISTSTTLDFIIKALDDFIFIKVTTSAGFQTVTSLSDGKFVGQAMRVQSLANDLTFPSSLSNIQYDIVVLADTAQTLVWEGSYWS